MVLQSEAHVPLAPLPAAESLDRRRYGRDELLIWVKEAPADQEPARGTDADSPSPR